MRVTVRRTRRAYVLPATHFASRHTDPDFPRMGERLRLRRDFDTSGFPAHARAILEYWTREFRPYRRNGTIRARA